MSDKLFENVASVTIKAGSDAVMRLTAMAAVDVGYQDEPLDTTSPLTFSWDDVRMVPRRRLNGSCWIIACEGREIWTHAENVELTYQDGTKRTITADWEK